MFGLYIAMFFIAFLFSSDVTAAVQCISGCGDVYTTINSTLNSDENKTGKTKNSAPVGIPQSQIRYTSNGISMQWIAYSGEPISEPTRYNTDWVYKKIDDYISVAISRTSPCVGNTGTIYAPFNVRIYTGTGDNCKQKVHRAGDVGTLNTQQLQTRVKITKKIIGGTYTRNVLIARAGYCQPDLCSSAQFTRNIYLSLNITAPESCEINAGQVIDINFGNISSGAFKTAGAIAQGRLPQSRDISVKCDNISGNAQLTMRMQADKTSGNIVVSDENNDVGFRVTNNSGVPLIPNNLSSVIPFTLDSNARQNVTIQAYPVSVTGNKPTEGPVTSRAYLRVDFP